MSLQAYQKTIQTTASPRQTEYRLFAEITGELLKAQDSGKRDASLVEALDRNKRLWMALAGDCRSPGNQLPDQTKASIISLSLFVNKHSSAVVRGEEDIEDLIEINRIIMQGLNGAPQT